MAISLKEYTQPQLWKRSKQKEKQRDTAITQRIEALQEHPTGCSDQEGKHL